MINSKNNYLSLCSFTSDFMAFKALIAANNFQNTRHRLYGLQSLCLKRKTIIMT